MTIKYGKFELPETIELEKSSATKTFGRFIAEPFERGYAHTVGNSLRRILLTSIESPSIISVRLEGVPHEYMPIDGIIEDMTNIVLNFKCALLRKLSSDESGSSRPPRVLTSTLDITQSDLDSGNGQYAVKLGDVIKEGNYGVINPELHLFNVTKPMKKQVDLRIGYGRGYVPSERHSVGDLTAGEILLDSTFSPVRLVNYIVQHTRVGQDTDFDKLVLEITTDGRITPSEALAFSSQIAHKHYDIFQNIHSEKVSFDEVEEEAADDEDEIMEKLSLRIDEIELSVRSTNCLSGANIDTIGELVTIPERKMLEFRNFGKKSLNEIKAKLEEMGLSLGMDLSRHGITQDNIKDRIRQYLEEHPKPEIEELLGE